VEVDAELVGDHVRERGLAEPRRAGEQEVIERLAALARRPHADLEVLDRVALADVLVEVAWTQRRLPRALVATLGGRHLARRVGVVVVADQIDVLLARHGSSLPRHAPQRVP
jgi:hypothetical protein